jgi:hypothetical protein
MGELLQSQNNTSNTNKLTPSASLSASFKVIHIGQFLMKKQQTKIYQELLFK